MSMQNILIIGAGKSSSSLISYMLDNAVVYKWKVIVGDLSIETAQERINGHAHGRAVYFNADDDSGTKKLLLEEADIVLSLLPAHKHAPIAEMCVQLKKHFICASYVSDEMQQLHAAAIENNVILLNEMGLDPGIDHMSAMQMMDEVRSRNGKILSFESYTGGLIHPDYDTNPWQYKFTWNPRNVVLAGQGTAKFLHNKKYKYIPYQKLFERCDVLSVPNYGEFEGYPNRDSLKYREIYGLQDALTIVRGTLRKKGFCEAWNVFVQLGMTDDSYIAEGTDNLTWSQFTNAFLPESNTPLKTTLQQYLHITNEEVMQKLEWLGIFSDQKINMHNATPAQVLQKLLEEKWKLAEGDKDMCVMLHVMEYILDNKKYRRQASMVATGDDEAHTAMAKTVGLPMGIAAKMILQSKFERRGVLIPVYADIYEPVLTELKQDFGIDFVEEEVKV